MSTSENTSSMKIDNSLQRKIANEYWVKKLSGRTDSLSMPNGKSQQDAQSTEAVKMHIDPDIVAQVKRLCHHKPMAEFTMLLSVYALLIKKYFNLEGITITTAASDNGEEGNPGHSYLFFQVTDFNNLTLKALILEMQSEISGAFTHKNYNLDSILTTLERKKINKKQLLECGFGYSVPGFSAAIPEGSVMGIQIVQDQDDNWEAELRFDPSCFDITICRQILSHFNFLLEGIHENIHEKVDKIGLLTPREKQTYTDNRIAQFSEIGHYKKYHSIAEAFQSIAASFPQQMAIVSDAGQWTYKELNEKCNQVAHYLRSEYNVHPEEPVGLLVNSPGWVLLGMLSIIKSGGAFVPIDPQLPKARKNHIIEDAGIKTVIIEFDMMFDLGEHQLNLFAIDVQAETLETSSQNPDLSIARNQLLYIIYTSGTTGMPKGVMVENESLLNYVSWLSSTYALDHHDKAVLLSSYAFDLGYTAIWGALLNGGCLHLPHIDFGKSGTFILDYLVEHDISFIKITPSLFYLLLNNNTFEAVAGFVKLRLLFLGGEPINVQAVRKYLEHCPDTVVINHYGPTEATIGTVACTLPHNDLAAYEKKPFIGKGILNCETLIIDGAGNLVPDGVQGELCISGPGVARGYLNQPELTKTSFIENPFDKTRVMYKTGDIAYRKIADGNITLIGRKDNQVKLRGYRIELHEITYAIRKHKEVNEAFARIVKNKNGSVDLVAYYTNTRSDGNEVTTLNAFLSEYLPGYMIPGFLVPLKQIPVNANGKIDIKALPRHTVSEKDSYVQPETAEEKLLVEIWEEVLDRKPIGITDDFFKLGGHSLKATQLLTTIHQKLNTKITLNDVFDFPTIKQLAGIAKQAEEINKAAIEAVEEQEYYPISYAQRRLWIIEQFEEAHGAYNVHNSFDFENLDLEAFKEAVQMLFRRHEVLRVSFITVDGEPKQKVNTFESLGFKIGYEDLREEENPETKAETIANTERRKPFNLSKGPLLRIKLLQLSDSKFRIELNIHHIIFDGWSKEIFFQEFNTLYNGLTHKTPKSSPALYIQYKDYTVWQHNQLQLGLWDESRAYWHEQLKGEIPMLALPSDFHRPTMKTYNGKGVTFYIDQKKARDFQKLCQDQGATFFMGLLSIVKLLLYKYTNQEDIIIGSPIAGRYSRELEEQLGFYVNTLALRTLIDHNDSYTDLLAKVKATTVNAYEHQSYPFDLLVEELNLRRDMSRTPLFDVMVLLQNVTDTTHYIEEEIGITKKLEFNQNEISKFDLTFTFREIGNGVLGHLNFNTDLFMPARIEAMIGHLGNLLDIVTNNSEQSIATLNYLTATETALLLEPITKENVNYPKETTIHSLFQYQAALTPKATALIYQDNTLSYEELNNQANRIARYLQQKYDVKPGDLVGLMIDRSELMIAGILGILKSGAAYVPIDPEYPEERKQYIIKDASVKLLICAGEGPSQPKGLPDGVTQIDLREIAAELSELSIENPENVNAPGDLAYVIYTSGSSGKPKGVLIEHSNVVRLLINDAFQFEFSESDSWTLFHSICFDFSVWEMFGALLYGGKLVIVTKETAQNAMSFAELLTQHKITILNQVPGAFNTLIHEILNNGSAYDIYLRYVIFGGEALNPSSLKEWYERYPGVRLVNMYGITETTVHTTFKQIGAEEINQGYSNIGKAIPTVSLQLLDDHGNLVPKGIVGEICVGGKGVARGYLNRPELTHERFIYHPLIEEERLYLSGDLGMRLQNGELAYMGRKDFQVKIRGYRIELGEIENVLIRHKDITDAVVLGKTDTNHDNYLVSYYIGEELDYHELEKYLLSILPSYMVPNYLIHLPEFPRTSNGKVDTKALPTPDQIRSEDIQKYIAPTKPIEKQLVWIWEKILAKDHIGIEDNFFELGGNSLSAARLVTYIYKDLGLKINLRVIFNFPTITLLAHELEEVMEEQGIKQPAIEMPLIPFQKQIWFLEEVNNNAVAKNIYITAAFHGEIDLPNMQAAYKYLLERHSVLRTEFISVNGEPLQKTGMPDDSKAIEIVDVRKEKNIKKAVADTIRNTVSQPLSLEKDSPVKACLLQSTNEDYHFVLLSHAILLDEYSLSVLLQELLTTYKDLSENLAPSLPLNKNQCIIDHWKDDDKATLAKKQYWLDLFKEDFPDLNFLIETKPLHYSFTKGIDTMQIGTPIVAGLGAIADNTGTDLFAVLNTALNLLIYRYTGRNKFIIWTTIMARESYHDDTVAVGPYDYTLPFINRIDKEDTLQDLLIKTKKNIHKAKEHRYPFEHIVDTSEKIFEQYYQFEVMINLKKDEEETILLNTGKSELKISHITSQSTANVSNILFDFIPKEEGLNLNIEYNKAFIDAGKVKRLKSHLNNILDHLPDNLDVSVADLDYMSAAEKEQLQYDFNNTGTCNPPATFITSFEKQVERSPQAAAVVYEGKSVSYEKLNQTANQMAGHLKNNHKINPEEPVGVLLKRSFDPLITALAIFKAGGVYLPIDTSLPESRIKEIINDAEIRILLSEKQFEETLDKFFHTCNTLKSIQYLDSDADSRDITGQSSGNLSLEIEPAHLAYCIYTSGSTGKPKGVLIGHGNLSSTLQAEKLLHQLDQTMISCQTTNYSFDVSLLEMLLPIANGGTVVIPHHERVYDSDYLSGLIENNKVTDLQGTPTFITSFLVEPLEENKRKKEVPLKSLKRVWIGGDSLSEGLVHRLQKELPHVTINNHYGPTEITIDCIVNKDLKTFNQNIIGKPLSNAEIFILDEQLKLLPIGIIGEICVGGKGVGRGYMNNVVASSEKFIESEFGRIYRTGDFGYWSEDGNIIYIGRKDEQVKIRGHRIETGEIRSALMDHPMVGHAVVLPKEIATGEKELTAYLQLSDYNPIELWPSIGTYPIYDDFLYQMMSMDSVRNKLYEESINKIVPGKVVIEIGPGSELVLTMMCVNAGAEKIYAIEWSEEAYNKAKKKIEKLGLQNKIILIYGNALETEIPEKIDVYISDQIGDIGSAEGAIRLNNHARKLLKDPGEVIPRRCSTHIAAIMLPPHQPIDSFKEVQAYYARKIMETIGNEFDLRVSLKYLDESYLISDIDFMEDLDFALHLPEEDAREIQLNVIRDGHINGLTSWIQLYLDTDKSMDSLRQDCNWLPIYFPVFDEAVQVKKGDKIKGLVKRLLDEDGYHPNYIIEGALMRDDTVLKTFEFKSAYQGRSYGQNQFYKQLFKGGYEKKPLTPKEEIRQYLEAKLPRYMVPSGTIILEKLPMTPSGKIDREALINISPSDGSPNRQSAIIPKTPVDKSILKTLNSELHSIPPHDKEEINSGEYEIAGNKLLTAVQQKIINKVNATHINYPGGELIHQLFERAVVQYADQPALVCGDNTLTYEELNTAANRLAHYIKNQYTIASGQLVGIFTDRSENLIISILATLKSGAAYLSIDKEYPEERIKFILDDSSVNIIITDADFDKAEGKQDIVNLSKIQHELKNYSDENPAHTATPQSVAYTIYTSGSTGKPKGVLITHEAVVDYCYTFSNYFEINNDDIVIQQSSFSFDTAVEETFPTLNAGAKLILMPQGGRDIHELVDAMINFQVTILSTTPMVIHEINKHDCINELVLRALISGGDSLKPSYIDQLITQVDIYNTYGPTEATVCTTFGRVHTLEDCKNIGYPIRNHQVYLLDRSLEQVAIDTKGEIYIAGNGLSLGYLNQPQLTKEYFIQSPFNPSEILYKTGDMALWKEDGNLVFLGRKDRQVKVNGYRVELNEVEEKIAEIARIREAATIACTDMAGNTRIVAYYTSTLPIDKDHIRKNLLRYLPPYMVPSYLVELEEFPTTSSGKIDRKALANMALGNKSEDSPIIVPRNYIERSIVKIWHDVLHLDQISIDTNFFDLGGHSIRAARISAMIYEQFQVKINIKEVFDNPTVEALAKIVQETEKFHYGVIEPLEEQEYYMPSHAQKRMWILDQIEREGISAYNMPFVWEMKGLSLEVAQKAFTLLIRRHESLRTTFVTIEGEPRQKVHRTENFEFKIRYIDLRGRQDQDTEARKLVNAENVIPFDLEKGPLLRCTIIQLDEIKQLFLLTLQHTIGDAWSMEVFENDYKALYNAVLNHEEANLVPLKIHYRDHSAWQNNFLEQTNGQSGREYWMKRFQEGVPFLQFPTDFPRPNVKTYNGDIIGELLPPEFSQRLNEISHQLSVSVTMLFMASVKAFLYKYTGQQDLTIGSPIIGRDVVELENQIGFYANTLAIRTVFDASENFEKLVYRVRENILDAFDYQLYPFDKLVEDLNFQRDLSRSPLFDVMVIHHNVGTGDKQKELEGIEVNKFLKEVQRSKFDLTFNFADAGKEILFSINYNTDLFKRKRIERVMQHYKDFLLAILNNLDKPIKDISYITNKERKFIAESFNNNPVEYNIEKLIHEYFEEKVKEVPDAPAVKYEDRELTYSELNEKSNRLAHHLRSNYDIRQDSLFGVMISRTDWLPVALLGILKAGAACVPVDPNYPVKRNKTILNDASILGIISEKEIVNDTEYARVFSNLSVIDLEEDWPEIEKNSPANPEKKTNSQALAYLVYTSGSTGIPKAVAIAHQNIAAFLAWSWKEYEDDQFDIAYGTTSYCFDLSLFEVFYTLTVGKPIRILNSGTDIDRWLPNDRNVMINTVPSVIQNLLERKVDLHNISVLNMAGEPIPYAIKEQLDQQGIEARNVYGPSEYVGGTSCFRLTRDRKEILIGKPLSNTQVLILDENQDILPIGIKGEIYIGGNSLTRGYLNQPELTSQKFVDHPFEEGKKLFKSGDIGMWNDEGEIAFFGRIDNQVKIRGYRIELGEIESVINRHPNVEVAIVEVKENNQDEKHLVAYYSGKETEPAGIRSYLSEQLPNYMIPSVFIHMDTWRLTPNGKVDRKKLPDPKAEDFRSLSPYKAPTSDIEKALVNIWIEVLNIDKIGVQDNFFDSGGHSLNATQILSRIYLEFGINVKLNLIFTKPTIEEIALAIENLFTEKQKDDDLASMDFETDHVII